MKELTEEEYQDRIKAVQRAYGIFSDLTEGNISKSFQAYQLIFAEREREIFLTTRIHGNRPRTEMDKYERPKCECGSDMLFRMVPPNDEGIKCQLVCSNQNCDIVLNSENDIHWWMANLRIKDERI